MELSIPNCLTASNDGLSVTKATFISNLATQNAEMNASKLAKVKPFKRVMLYNNTELTLEDPTPLSKGDIVHAVTAVGTLYGLVAYIRHATKVKEALITSIENMPNTDLDALVPPPMYEQIYAEMPIHISVSDMFEALPLNDLVEYLSAEAQAAHIGRFIHNNGALATTRAALNTPELLQWAERDRISYPVKLTAIYNAADLLSVHTILAVRHKDRSARVNYFKANAENNAFALNRTLQNKYANDSANIDAEMELRRNQYLVAKAHYDEEVRACIVNHNNRKLALVNQAKQLKIVIPIALRETVNEYLNLVGDSID
jgi:PBP1b-binding outer membrane lipoprotein LpoB